MGRLRRAHHPDLPEEAGSIVALAPEEAHHIHRVLRLRTGEEISVFDGRGSEWLATLESCEPGRATLRLESRITQPVEPRLGVRLYQGLCRLDRMDWLVQKATEVGLAAVAAVRMERSESYRIGEERLRRWRRIAIEACKQSGRRVVPRIALESALPAPTADGVLALALDPGPDAPPLAAVFAAPPPREVWLAVGPEGGFAPAERAAWSAAGWRPAGLGPRILRADTAGPVAAAILLHRWADLGS